MHVPKIQNNNYNTNYKGHLPLRREISSVIAPTPEKIKDLYGTFGLDVYEGKKIPTILSKEEIEKSKTLGARIKSWFKGEYLFDYEERDSLGSVVFKYLANKKSGYVKDIENMFGKKGLEAFDNYTYLGYIQR